MNDERGARPVLPNLAIPPDPDLALPDLGGSSRPPVRPADEYRPMGPPRRVQPPVRDRAEDRPLPPVARAVALAAPYGAIAAIAVLPTGLFSMVPFDALPFSLVLMVLSQVVGWWIGRSADAEPLIRICLMNVVTLVIVLPFLALQASAVRVPYVSAEFGTATPAIIATVVAVAATIGAAMLAVGLASDGPEQAALLFAPAAFMVPELLGAPFEPEIGDILRRILEVYALAAVLAFVSPVAPRVMRALLPPAGLAFLFVVLWVLDRGPTLQRTSGDVVRVLDGALLVTSVVLIVAVPVVAIGVRRVMWEMRGGRL